MPVAGQLRYSTEGLDEDISVACGDSGSDTPTVIIDNNPFLVWSAASWRSPTRP